MDQIKEALLTLDPADDAHWTEDGLPIIQVLGDMVGREDLTREWVSRVAPDFGRETLRKIKADSVFEEQDIPEDTSPEVQLVVQVRDVDNLLNELYEEQEKLNVKITDAQRLRSRLASKQAHQRNEGTNQQAIRASIDCSNQQRAYRVAAHQAVVGKLTLGQLDPRSKYEQSRANNRTPQPSRV